MRGRRSRNRNRFSLDFYDHEENLRAKEERVTFEITESGIFNAVAFWFDLELDDVITLTTKPFAEHGKKGATCQQVVQ